MMRVKLAGCVAAVLAVAGCGASEKPDEPKAGGQSAEAKAIDESGCENDSPAETEELYVRALITCDGFDLYVYDTSSARDKWSAAAAEFGTVELKRGDSWIAVKP
jgi:hypothetical protein